MLNARLGPFPGNNLKLQSTSNKTTKLGAMLNSLGLEECLCLYEYDCTVR